MLSRSGRPFGNAAFCSRPSGYHLASTLLDEIDLALDEGGEIADADSVEQWIRAVDSWPTICGCGYLFVESDEKTLRTERIFAAPGVGLTTIANAPVGAMWWDEPSVEKERPHLWVKLPGGLDFDLDGRSSGGGGWKRRGNPPDVTVTPSIAVPGYHGWVTGGYVSADLEGRSYS